MATREVDIRDCQFVVSNAKVGTKLQVHTWDLSITGDVILAHTNSKASVIKDFKFPLQDGTLYFYNGMDTAYAYFRTAKFKNFLKANQINSVVRADANMDVAVGHCYNAYESSSIRVKTDGKVDDITQVDFGRTEEWQSSNSGTQASEGYNTVKVSDASWLIVEEKKNGRTHRTLYTLEDIYSLNLS